jgi:hypothetical protein
MSRAAVSRSGAISATPISANSLQSLRHILFFGRWNSSRAKH